MGGKDSRSAAPKDDDGLKGFRALKPVVCGWRAVGDEVEVAPVGWLDNDENSELDIVVDPVAVGEVDLCREDENDSPDRPFVWAFCVALLLLDRANSDATLAMREPLVPPVVPNPPEAGFDGGGEVVPLV